MTRADLASSNAPASTCAANLTYDSALTILAAEARPLGVERVPINKVGRRVLAEPFVAQLESPRFDVAAMDGYAVRADVLDSGRTDFKVVARSYAGDAAASPLGRARAVYVTTGAALPLGATEILPWEIVAATDDRITLHGPRGRRHVRERGSDFRRGDVLLPAGRMIDPRALVAIAAADVATLGVWRQPRVALITTGNELIAPGLARTTELQVPDSLSHALILFVRQWGGRPISGDLVADNASAISRATAAALARSDVLVLVGGASQGERDFAKVALESLGLECRFAKVAIKPGKPVWNGCIGDKHVLGLPGNPTAALTTARLFLAPLLAALGGRPTGTGSRWSLAPLAEAMPANGDREAFLCAALDDDGVRQIEQQSASSQAILALADVLIRRPANAPAANAGEEVPIVRF